jgi:excisionase family DNA binding protein
MAFSVRGNTGTTSPRKSDMSEDKKERADDVLDAEEASTWLKIPKSTLYKLCVEGELPAAKVGRHWRFHRETLEQWLLDQSKPKKKSKA